MILSFVSNLGKVLKQFCKDLEIGKTSQLKKNLYEIYPAEEWTAVAEILFRYLKPSRKIRRYLLENV